MLILFTWANLPANLRSESSPALVPAALPQIPPHANPISISSTLQFSPPNSSLLKSPPTSSLSQSPHLSLPLPQWRDNLVDLPKSDSTLEISIRQLK
ncbi:unnamed protein product [Linum trigynum]|uniref:Uncharacterized protein n=1 Tax=Linum trigynum TaxID=586398 RepID=A0AAV2FT33_9ROSI